ncbi:MAG: 7-cyano-7-deazaguanine/7-aminomethyl-7-deazaguanine transporter [Burkholderiaceae bacterium]|nr:7-cyano-7-deazaguanine/7-aminomethyl-7-deazaguanine transporter [Burkholderiaceae bacterium]
MNEQLFPLKKLWLAHIFFIVLSNYAVQLPITVLGIETTWGTFTYPFLFLLTDLTVRLFGDRSARRIVFFAMWPSLLLSYLIGTLFQQGAYQGLDYLSTFSVFVFRIALASFVAYAVGQLMDIHVFQRLREKSQWWLAPAAATTVGNLIDTLIFYSVAFYQTTDAYMAENWFSLACVDYAVKMLAGLLIFVPMYGAVLGLLLKSLGGKLDTH